VRTASAKVDETSEGAGDVPHPPQSSQQQFLNIPGKGTETPEWPLQGLAGLDATFQGLRPKLLEPALQAEGSVGLEGRVCQECLLADSLLLQDFRACLGFAAEDALLCERHLRASSGAIASAAKIALPKFTFSSLRTTVKTSPCENGFELHNGHAVSNNRPSGKCRMDEIRVHACLLLRLPAMRNRASSL
jgi:hypothetical protein